MTENILKEKAFKFALRIVKLNRYLIEKKEFTLSKQIYRSGTSIGANVDESTQGESPVDFIHKLSIARKEAVETEYWILLFKEGAILSSDMADSLLKDCHELLKILTASIKTAKENEARKKSKRNGGRNSIV